MNRDAEAVIAAAWAALNACDWATAQSRFEHALESRETPDTLDGLGQAFYWQHEYATALRLRERAYALYRQQGDRHRAALVAIRLAYVHGLVYGNAAAVNGWIGHAQRTLEDCGDCAEQGWLEVFLACIASDPGERQRRARIAVEIGRRFASPSLEFDALAYLGKAHVETGAVDHGMRLIDEAVAAAASGVVTDPWAAGEIYCTLFHACEMAIDAKRAEEWLDAVDGYVDRTGELPVSALCRMHYGALLTSAGRWTDAERELQTALEIYSDTYQGTRFEPLLRLADLRARQGRVEEAQRLLEGHENRPEAVLPYTRVLLARDEPERAQAALDRHLPVERCPLPSAPTVALAVDVALACGAVGDARRRADDLGDVAAATGLSSVRGLAARAHARIAQATGESSAAEHFDDALAAFDDAELAYELATTRLELARLLAEDDTEHAGALAHAALDCFQRLGAIRDADAASEVLRQLGEPGRSWPRGGRTLTGRQREVLDLLAEGLSNIAIAERLYISPRTAEHHVSNILSALHLNSRAEATAYAVRHGLQR
ncbi:MAG: LuxR C-terminal-related transcriptional regulator [Egibacteraceae bacterium]